MDEAGGLVTAIRDQVNTLDALTEEYLAFARFPKPHFEEESINHLLEELADFLRPVATRQGLTINVANDPAAPMMEVDRPLLRQAVLNLLKNGMEALSRGGAITLGSRWDGEALEVFVSDTGSGHHLRGRGPAVRAVLHHQAAGNGTGPVHHPADHRGARRRADLAQRRGRRGDLHHPAASEGARHCLSRPRCSSPTTIPDCARASSAR